MPSYYFPFTRISSNNPSNKEEKLKLLTNIFQQFGPYNFKVDYSTIADYEKWLEVNRDAINSSIMKEYNREANRYDFMVAFRDHILTNLLDNCSKSSNNTNNRDERIRQEKFDLLKHIIYKKFGPVLNVKLNYDTLTDYEKWLESNRDAINSSIMKEYNRKANRYDFMSAYCMTINDYNLSDKEYLLKKIMNKYGIYFRNDGLAAYEKWLINNKEMVEKRITNRKANRYDFMVAYCQSINNSYMIYYDHPLISKLINEYYSATTNNESVYDHVLKLFTYMKENTHLSSTYFNHRETLLNIAKGIKEEMDNGYRPHIYRLLPPPLYKLVISLTSSEKEIKTDKTVRNGEPKSSILYNMKIINKHIDRYIKKYCVLEEDPVYKLVTEYIRTF